MLSYSPIYVVSVSEEIWKISCSLKERIFLFKSTNYATGTENVFFFSSCRDTTEHNKHFTFIFDHEGFLRRLIENCK